MTEPEAEAEAILWKGGRIALVGTTTKVETEARRLGIPVQDMGGRVVLPGFVDAHTHFLHVGVKKLRPDLRGAKSKEEAFDRLREFLRRNPGSAPVIAEGWDESEWKEPVRPTGKEIDDLVAEIEGDRRQGSATAGGTAVGDGGRAKGKGSAGQGSAGSAGPPPAASAKERPGTGAMSRRAVVLRRICGHIAIANSAAVPAIKARFGAGAVGSDGLVLEAASLYLNEVLPVPAATLDWAIQEASRDAHRLGVTTVGDYSQAPYRAALQRAAAAGTLTVRVASSIYVQQLKDEMGRGFRTGRPGLAPTDLAPASRDRLSQAATKDDAFGPTPGLDGGRTDEGGASPWLRDGGLKVFLDGSLGGHTAHLREPYLDGPPPGHPCTHEHPRGTPIWKDADVAAHFQTADAARIQIHAHAIGDAAIDQGLDGFGGVLGKAPIVVQGDAPERRADPPSSSPRRDANPLRHRFEHFEIHHDDQIARTARLGVVASSQPNFVGEWSSKGGMYHDRLGERFRLNNRFRTLRAAGIELAFGSDGMPFGPLIGIQSAVYHPEAPERLTPEEAVWHYTERAAWSLHWPETGSLQEGHWADLVVLDAKDLKGPPVEWGIRQTFTAGTARLPSAR